MRRPLLELKVSDGWATGVRFLPDGGLITTGFDPLVKRWSREGTLLREFRGHAKSVDATATFAGGARLLTGSVDATARVWDVETGAELGVLEGHKKTVAGVAVTSDGRLGVTGSYDRTIRLWDLEAMRGTAVLKGHRNNVVGVVVSPDDAWLATGGVGTSVLLWRLPSGELARTLEQAHPLAAIPVAFTPSGSHLLTIGADDTLARWTVPDLAEESRVPAGGAGVRAATLSPDGKTVAVAVDHGVRLLDLASGDVVDEIAFEVKGVYGVSFSADGAVLATATSDSFVRTWRLG